MAGNLRSLRRRVLTPNVSATKLRTRGFHEKDAESRDLLENVGATFLTGYGHAVEARTVAEAEERLEEIPVRFRGFAYEGAAMGLTVLDALPGGGSRRLAALLAGRGNAHIYMAYIGAGWAMARVPRFRWSKISLPDPLLRWLALDGYGFHQAYFKTDRYVHQHHEEPRFPWPADDPHRYARHAIDQGIGRALWFVGGTDVRVVCDLIDGFADSRQADLWAGAGLAATYAGGSDEQDLREFARRAGPYRVNAAQGSAFAAKARLLAGLSVAHTAVGTGVLCGVSPEEAAQICDDTRKAAADAGDGEMPAFERWRRDIALGLVARGGVR
ncbi:DUF1702 family protein [Actinomadura terrae]|uniref:DUF1702 family protein n=1 Tax=Actinomadura terrae TaxID=604353 RepID=UPI001FA7996C|nr:DUF1702 family protein [Actinomadura terrae]